VENPYDEQAMKRQAQVGALRGQEPVNTKMGGDSTADFLQLAGRYAPKPSGLTSLFADQGFKERFPNARIHKNDWVDLGDGTELLDTVRGFNPETDSGEAWQALTESEALKGKAREGRAAQQMWMHPAADNSALMRIMDELNATSEGRESPAAREAMLAMLGGR
jgi:hypothetical protein